MSMRDKLTQHEAPMTRAELLNTIGATVVLLVGLVSLFLIFWAATQ